MQSPAHVRIGAVLLIGLALSGCARAFITTDPPIARLSVNGRQVGVGKATIPTQSGRVVIVRADHEGFRPTCAVVPHRRDTTITLSRAIADDRPLPSDADIEREWIATGKNLCVEAAEQQKPPEVVITAGDLSQPYEILGDVQVDTTDESNFGAAAKDVFARGALLATIKPELKGEHAEMLYALRAAAIAKYGAKVDAVINTDVFTEDRDVYARGTAVHFVEALAAKPRTVSERLEELDKLGGAGMITPQEYKARRKAILEDL